MSGLNTPLWGYIIVVAAVVVAYGPALDNEFTYDDRGLVLGDQRVSEADWRSIVGQSYWGDAGDGLYRPLTTASLALNWGLGKDQPWSYHLINMLLHALAAGMVVYAVSLLYELRMGVVAGLLFALQPGPSEAVFSIVGRAEILACCLGLGAIICGLSAREKGGLWRWGCVFGCLVGSMLAKENGMAFAAGLLVWEMAAERRIRTMGAIALAAMVCAVGVKWWAIGMLVPVGIGYLDNPLAYGTDAMRFAHGFGLLARALVKMIFPWPLVADYSPQQIPLYNQWWTGEIVWPLVFVVHLAACTMVLMRNEARWCLWLGISAGAMLATSNILVTTGTIFAERLLYIPAAGLSVALAWCWGKMAECQRRVGLAIWMIVAMGMLWDRAAAWRDDQALFKSVVDKHPLSARGHYGLGLALQRQGDAPRAIASYKRATALYPRYLEAEYNRAAALVEVGDFRAATEGYRRVVELRPNHINARHALALLELEFGAAERGEAQLRKLHRERERDVGILRSLVDFLLRSGRSAEARDLVAERLEADGQKSQLREILALINAQPPP